MVFVAKHTITKGDTSRIEYIFIQNSSLTTGAGLTGLAFNSAGLTAYYVRAGAAATSVTLATQTAAGAFSSGGFVEVDATNMPGVYRFDPPNAAFASGVDKVIFILKGATNMAPVTIEYQLTDVDLEVAAMGAVMPTVAGRTLDVSAAGEAGLDINNIAALTAGPLALFGIVESGTAQSATATTLVGRAAATDGIVKAGNTLFVHDSTLGYWQSVAIDSVAGDTFTIAAWPTATPAATITYLVMGTPAQSPNILVSASVAALTANRAEPGQGAPAASTSMLAKLDYLYKAWRNRTTQTATEYSLFADDAVTKDQKATCSSDGTTLVRGEIATGP